MDIARLLNILVDIYLYEDSSLKKRYQVIEHKADNHLLSSGNAGSRIDLLPLIVQEIIFKQVDNLSRIKIAFACPQHMETVLLPLYWTSFPICFRETVICFEDLNFLCQYLKNHIKKFNVDLNSYKNKWIDSELYELFKKLSNLEVLICNAYSLNESNSIVALISKHISGLKYIDISWSKLSNIDVISMGDGLVNLKSILITTDRDIRFGLKYLFKKAKPLKRFGLIQTELFIDSETLSELSERSNKSLENMKLSSKKLKVTRIVNVISQFKKLEKIQFHNLREFSGLSHLAYDLDHLKELLILFDIFQNYFLAAPLFLDTKPKKYLRKVVLKNLNITIKILSNIAQNCPCLEELFIEECLIIEVTLKKAFEKMNNLKRFYYFEKFRSSSLWFSFIKEIPHNLLQKLECITLYMEANDDEDITKLIDTFLPITSTEKIESKLFIKNELVLGYPDFLVTQ